MARGRNIRVGSIADPWVLLEVRVRVSNVVGYGRGDAYGSAMHRPREVGNIADPWVLLEVRVQVSDVVEFGRLRLVRVSDVVPVADPAPAGVNRSAGSPQAPQPPGVSATTSQRQRPGPQQPSRPHSRRPQYRCLPRCCGHDFKEATVLLRAGVTVSQDTARIDAELPGVTTRRGPHGGGNRGVVPPGQHPA
jgi:hypothetical protein